MHTSSNRPEDVIELPPSDITGGMPLHNVLHSRRSCREFTTEPLSLQQMAQLCWSAQGLTSEEGHRTAPSAGARYPLTLFLATADGLFAYDPHRHALHQRRNNDIRKHLQASAVDQECLGEVPFCLIITMNVRQMSEKYGDRAARYCVLEAGHVAQNVVLQATALGLGSVPVGAFEDERVCEALQLPEELLPVYLLPVGHPS